QALRTAGCHRDNVFERLALKASVANTVDDTLQAAISGYQLQRRGQKRSVIFTGFGIHQMNRSDIALAALGRREPPGAADIQRFYRNRIGVQPVDQYVEADTMTTDHHEIGKVSPADQLHLNRGSGGNAL